MQPLHVDDAGARHRPASRSGQRAGLAWIWSVPQAMTTDVLTATSARHWLGLPARPAVDAALYGRSRRPPGWAIACPRRHADAREPGHACRPATPPIAAPMHAALGWLARPLGTALAAEPATQDGLTLARLAPMRSVLLASLCLVWVGTGVVSAALSAGNTDALLGGLGLAGGPARSVTLAGAALDVGLGLALLSRHAARRRRGGAACCHGVLHRAGDRGAAAPVDRPVRAAAEEPGGGRGHPGPAGAGGLMTMPYEWLLYVHVISSTLLFGTGLGTAFHGWMAHRSAAVWRLSWWSAATLCWRTGCSPAPAVIVQPITGVWMAHRAGLPMTSGWLALAICLYAFIGACWLPVVWLQIRMHRLARSHGDPASPLPPAYFACARAWFALGWPAFLGVLGIFYLMLVKPDL